MRHKKIREEAVGILEDIIRYIKKSRKRKSMPFKEIETIIRILFPRTKHYKGGKGFFKHVFVIHSSKRKLVLKVGRSNKHLRKDFTTYLTAVKRGGGRYFAKIYWRQGLFMLQKYGKKTKVPPKELKKLKEIGKKCGLKDIRKANIMKFGKKFKIVDAERR